MIRKFVFPLALGCFAAASAFGQSSYPERPVRMIVPSSAGTITDILGREFAQVYSTVIKQPVVVENLVGADQQIGTEAVVRAKPDGYTMLFVSSSTTVLDPVLRASLPYDVSKDLLAGCAVFKSEIFMNMSATLPYKTAAEFVASAKEKAEKYNFAYSSATTRLAGEMFQQAAGVKLLSVPYKGSAGGLTDVAGGVTNLFFIDQVSAGPHYRTGKIKPMLVASPERLKSMPDVPTSSEAGFPGFLISPSVATWLPANTPPDILNAARASMDKALRSPEFAAVIAKHSLTPFHACGDVLANHTRDEIIRWTEIAKKGGLEKQ